MNRIIFFFIAIFCVSFSYSQKIKIKKDQITYDDKPIANIKSPYRDFYEISTLDNVKTLSAQYKTASNMDKSNTTLPLYQWLEITDIASGKTAEIPYEVLITAFSADRIIAHLLTVKYNLLNQNGINNAEFDNFFNKNTEKLSEKYAGIVQKEKVQILQAENEKKAMMAKYSPRVQNDGNIYFTINGRTQIVGKYMAQNLPMGTNGQYLTIYDLDNIAVATLARVTSFGENKATTWDGNTFDYYSKNQYNDGDYTFVQNFILDLLAKGYNLGHDASVKKKQLLNAKIDKAKQNSANIYDKNGYVIDEKGIKYEGKISIIFQMLDVNETGKVLPEFGPDNYGQKVLIEYINEKGKPRTKSFNAKDNTYFCLNAETEKCFYGLGTKGDVLKKLQNINSLQFNNAYYYQLIYKNNGIMVLQHPVETEKYVIKTQKQDKGIIINFSDNQSYNKDLSEYLSDCKAVSNDIKKNQFELKLEKSLLQIAEEYAQCK